MNHRLFFCGTRHAALALCSLLLGCTSEKQTHRPASTDISSVATPAKEPAAPVLSQRDSNKAETGNRELLAPASPELVAPTSPGIFVSEPTPVAPPTLSVLTAADGTMLPQAEERPTRDSPWFQENAVRLFSAIVKDDAESAQSFFFPKLAYAQVKAIANPDHDYETRLLKAFKADIHKYHQALGAERAQATFVELRVYEPGAKWVKPGQEGNRLGYFRVLRSVIVYRDAQERLRELALHTMISWRGEWYVIHLGPHT